MFLPGERNTEVEQACKISWFSGTNFVLHLTHYADPRVDLREVGLLTPNDGLQNSQENLAALLSGNWKARDGNHEISGKSFRCLLWVVVASYFRPSVLQVFSLGIYSRGNPRFLAIRGNSLLSKYSQTRISITISLPLAKTDPKPVGAHIFLLLSPEGLFTARCDSSNI